MHDQETQRKFVALRAQGRSFVRIATELGVCKSTLIEWSRKFRFEIHNLRAIEMEALQEEFVAGREERVRALGAQLRAVEAELRTRNVAELPTARLFALAESFRRQIRRETGEMSFSSPAADIPESEYHEEVQDWPA
jgi:hypothetical protein